MTREKLAALSERRKALAAERDRLVVRRETLAGERERLYDRHLALRDSIGRNILYTRAIQRERVWSQRDFGLLRTSMRSTSALGALDGTAGEDGYREEPVSRYLAANEQARSAA